MMGIRFMRRLVLPTFVASMYFFLYIPIAVLVVFSFNDSLFPFVWKGATLHWYKELWQMAEVWQAMRNSLIVAFSSVVLSLLLGLLTVYYSSRIFLSRFFPIFYGNLGAPEVVLAVGLLSFFVLFSVPLGLTTLIAAHTLIGLGYVIPMLHGRFSELDYGLIESSLDLGATHNQTFFRIIVPLMSPALMASGLLVFVVSLDDFIVSFFCTGATTQTLPLYIFAMIRSGATPVVNALSTLLLVISSILVLLFSVLKVKKMDVL